MYSNWCPKEYQMVFINKWTKQTRELGSWMYLLKDQKILLKSHAMAFSTGMANPPF